MEYFRSSLMLGTLGSLKERLKFMHYAIHVLYSIALAVILWCSTKPLYTITYNAYTTENVPPRGTHEIGDNERITYLNTHLQNVHTDFLIILFLSLLIVLTYKKFGKSTFMLSGLLVFKLWQYLDLVDRWIASQEEYDPYEQANGYLVMKFLFYYLISVFLFSIAVDYYERKSGNDSFGNQSSELYPQTQSLKSKPSLEKGISNRLAMFKIVVHILYWGGFSIILFSTTEPLFIEQGNSSTDNRYLISPTEEIYLRNYSGEEIWIPSPTEVQVYFVIILLLSLLTALYYEKIRLLTVLLPGLTILTLKEYSSMLEQRLSEEEIDNFGYEPDIAYRILDNLYWYFIMVFVLSLVLHLITVRYKRREVDSQDSETDKSIHKVS
ncbi:MAG: hypothetical protein ACXAD7_27550 [Candidatus Kariarchaeaceae archaeon]|jgi:hypothetical protein